MAEIALTKYGRDMRSVFDLLGRGEVDLTAALAWTLTHSPALMSALWQRLGLPGEPERADLEVTGNEGRTDLEIVGTEASAIVEAKKGWLVPGETQLSKYINHFTGGGERLFVTLSDSDPAWAATHLVDRIAGIPVRHLSWAQVRSDIATARASTRISTERHWLHEMNTYLPAATAERDPANQWVFCVVVSNNSPGAGTTTFRQYVERERIYFHPFGQGAKGWPKRAPTFMAFRWGGEVRHVARVVGRSVVAALADRWPEIGRDHPAENVPHAVYELGPDIPLPHRIPTRGTYANARVWTLLDQLLTAKSLAEATANSKILTEY